MQKVHNSSKVSTPIRTAMLVPALLLSFACTSEVADPSAMEEAASPIIGGQVDGGHPAVALLDYGADGDICTASLIAPTVLLTAAHCVVNPSLPKAIFDTASGRKTLSVKAVHRHPNYNPSDGYAGHDIGVAILAKAAPVTPMKYSRQSVSASLTGKTVDVVGWGIDENGDDRIKRRAKVAVNSVTSQLISSGSKERTTCYGDSGGPALRKIDGTDTIIGVLSFTSGYSDYRCHDGWHGRVDKNLGFIDKYARPSATAAQ